LPFAEFASIRYVSAVSTLVEIQEAISRLGEAEKAALSVWLESQSAPAMSASDEQRLLRSLDEAIRDVDTGKGVPLEEAHKLVGSWAQGTQ